MLASLAKSAFLNERFIRDISTFYKPIIDCKVADFKVKCSKNSIWCQVSKAGRDRSRNSLIKTS